MENFDRLPQKQYPKGFSHKRLGNGDPDKGRRKPSSAEYNRLPSHPFLLPRAGSACDLTSIALLYLLDCVFVLLKVQCPPTGESKLTGKSSTWLSMYKSSSACRKVSVFRREQNNRANKVRPEK